MSLSKNFCLFDGKNDAWAGPWDRGGGARRPDPPNFLTTEKTEEFTVLKTYIQYRLHK